MIDNEVWEFQTPADIQLAYDSGIVKNIISSSLFLKQKDADLLKVRLIIHGNHQILSEIFGSSSSPTININVMLIVLAIAAKSDYDFESADITGGYLNADLSEPEFMRIPSDLAKILVQMDPSYSKFVNKGGSMIVK